MLNNSGGEQIDVNADDSDARCARGRSEMRRIAKAAALICRDLQHCAELVKAEFMRRTDILEAIAEGAAYESSRQAMNDLRKHAPGIAALISEGGLTAVLPGERAPVAFTKKGRPVFADENKKLQDDLIKHVSKLDSVCRATGTGYYYRLADGGKLLGEATLEDVRDAIVFYSRSESAFGKKRAAMQEIEAKFLAFRELSPDTKTKDVFDQRDLVEMQKRHGVVS